jgi:hypothetical protein
VQRPDRDSFHRAQVIAQKLDACAHIGPAREPAILALRQSALACVAAALAMPAHSRPDVLPPSTRSSDKKSDSLSLSGTTSDRPKAVMTPEFRALMYPPPLSSAARNVRDRLPASVLASGLLTHVVAGMATAGSENNPGTEILDALSCAAIQSLDVRSAAEHAHSSFAAAPGKLC